jgi:hypothetical protein
MEVTKIPYHPPPESVIITENSIIFPYPNGSFKLIRQTNTHIYIMKIDEGNNISNVISLTRDQFQQVYDIFF